MPGRLTTLATALLIGLMLVLSVPPARAQQPCGETYTVAPGDTLFSIARRCGTTVEAILAANPSITNPDVIPVGLQLELPEPAADEQRDPLTYVVEPGNTLFSLARRFDTTVSAILQANPSIQDPDVINVGQRLVIPGEPGQPRVRITPAAGPPGTAVQVTVHGFPANTPVEIGVGPARSEFNVVAQAQTGPEGGLQTEVTIPTFADPNDRFVVVATAQGEQMIREVSNVFAVSGPAGEPPVFESVEVPLIALGGGDLGCGDRVVFVERQVQPTEAPLTAALRELLAIEERMVGQSGLYNPLFRSDLQVEEVAIQDSTAIIRLSGQLLLGGVCDDPRVAAQLRRIALQYSTVDEVQIFINGQPLDQVLSAR